MDFQESEFYKTRFKGQLEWLNKKAAHYKTLYVRGRIICIVCAALTPVLLKSCPEGWWQSIPIITSLAVGIATGLLSCFHPYKIWLQYRTTVESLVMQEWDYKAGIGEYKDASDKDELFARNVQAILSSEHQAWKKLQESITAKNVERKDS